MRSVRVAEEVGEVVDGSRVEKAGMDFDVVARTDSHVWKTVVVEHCPEHSASDYRYQYLGAKIDRMSIRIVIHAIRLWSNSNSQSHAIMANTMLHLLRLHHALANGMCRLRRSMTWC